MVSRFPRFVGLALCVLAALECARANAAAPPILIQRNAEAVLFQAPITPETRDQFLKLLDDGVKTVVVNSVGGDALAAIDMGREIRHHQVTVVVLGVCVGSCAQFLFVPARRRRVEPELLVVFQDTGTGLLKMIGAAKVPQATRDGLTARAKAEQALYAELGLSEAFLTETQAEILTRCFRYSDHPTGDAHDIEYASQFLGWTPTRAYLDASGVPVDGFWPEVGKTDDFMNAYKKLFTPQFRLRALGGDKPAEQARIDEAYKTFGHVCTDTELKTP